MIRFFSCCRPSKSALVLSLALAVGLVVVLPATEATAREDIRYEAVRFPPGASGVKIRGSVAGYNSVAYTLGAEAGQRMAISLVASNGATYFTVFGPGQAPGTGGLAGSDTTGPMVPDLNRFDATLPSSGNYTILVYLYRAAARRNEQSDYSLDITITGEPGGVVQGDFADGLQGGPDFYAVRTASAGRKVNLRSDPSSGAAVVRLLPDGTVLRNLGCRMNEGRRWCRVATAGDPGVEGWIAGDFLVESTGPGADVPMEPRASTPVPPDTDALVPGTSFSATGRIECVADADAAAAMCDFGVEREGNGNGWITVTMPGGRTLRVRFEDLTPVSFDDTGVWAGRRMTVARESDNHVVMIGDVRLVIPLAVMAGG